MRKTILLFILLLVIQHLTVFAQEARFIAGKVIDAGTGKPIAGCSVYFSNTSKGDVTSSAGEFLLKHLPTGKYDLVISAIGYGTEIVEVSSNNYPHKLLVKLGNQSTELAEVVVQPSLADGWQRWGETFLEYFIGTTPNAGKCRLKNHEALKFWYSQKNHRLTARADEPLIIENAALGYTIKYNLQEFVIDFNAQMFRYSGYPLFQEMNNSRKEAKWKENRMNAYYGSLLHFMRTVYNEKWHESGYQIITNVRLPNLEKQRVQELTDSTGIVPNYDSSAYYKKVLRQPDFFPKYLALAELDSSMLVADPEDGGKRFFFTDSLKILYRRYPPSKPIESQIYLSTPEPITIQENGSYHSPRELVTAMHWAMYEKMANLLPFDYEP